MEKACRARIAGVEHRLFPSADSPSTGFSRLCPRKASPESSAQATDNRAGAYWSYWTAISLYDPPLHVETQVLVAGLLRAQTGYLVADGPSVFPDGDAVDS